MPEDPISVYKWNPISSCLQSVIPEVQAFRNLIVYSWNLNVYNLSKATVFFSVIPVFYYLKS